MERVRPLIAVAHRTPAAPAACAELAAAGATTFEIDVQLRHDELVVSHYRRLGPPGWLERDNLHVRRVARAGQRHEQLLDEAIAAVPPDRDVLLDPKAWTADDRERLAERLGTDIAARPDAARFVVSTDDEAALAVVRAAGLRTWRTVRTSADLRRLLLAGARPDEAVTMRHRLCTELTVAALLERVPRVVAWTVNSPDRARALIGGGVTGITTDHLSVISAVMSR